MKNDLQVQKDIMEEIRWEPLLNASQIGVAVKNGVATLSGAVDTYAKKLAAEKAAARVAGVKAVAEDIRVGISPSSKKSDSEIAEAVLNALKWHSAVQEEKIKVKVENGVVSLDGEVEWDYERKNAKSAVQYLNGVKAVINLITLKRTTSSSDVEQQIKAAFKRSALVDAKKITADVYHGEVTLRGEVRSLAEKNDAEAAAWKAPGVIKVDSMIKVEAPKFSFEEE